MLMLTQHSRQGGHNSFGKRAGMGGFQVGSRFMLPWLDAAQICAQRKGQ